MFRALGRGMARARWTVLAMAAGMVLLGLFWGTGALEAMTSGGELDTSGPAAAAGRQVREQFGDQGVDVIVLYSSATATVDVPAFADSVVTSVQRLRGLPEVAQVRSYYGTGLPDLVSRDRRATFVTVRLTGADDSAKLDRLAAVRAAAIAWPGGAAVVTRLGGPIGFEAEAHDQVGIDLRRAELLSLPALLVLLAIIFGGVMAACAPLLVGGLAILGALTVTRLIATFTDVSVFALNIITLIGLGLAIDYSLFIVSRFREELTATSAVTEAIERTLATAGRTVATSGLIVIFALGSLLIFPRLLLRSLALGGMAAVLLVMVCALTVLPALLAVVGTRINALPLPLPWRRRARRAGAGPGPGPGQPGVAWARVARIVMRRPLLWVVSILVVLGLLASPFRRAEFGPVDERILPTSAQSRQVADRLAADFAGASLAPIQVLATNLGDPADLQRLVAGISALPDVTDALVTRDGDGAALISVSCAGPGGGHLARETVVALRTLPTPSGVRLSVAGSAANLVDALDELRTRLPWMLLMIATVLLVLLLVAFRSVVVPVKAILTTAVSVSASFGAIVWVFQDGHLQGLLGFTPTAALDADVLVLILAVLLGLSTDYEVFLLSRIREQWDADHDVPRAITLGLQRTGGIITSAALLLIVVVSGFTTGELLLIKVLGVGMIVAIIVDAAVVRPLLVPPTLRLLGSAAWWAPAAVARSRRGR